MIDQPLFAYGTLRDPDILSALLGRSLPASRCIAATAPGFRAVHFPARVYPALLAAPGAEAAGLLLHGLTPAELAVLDAFEGDEYRRGEITVLTASGPVAAQVYLPTATLSPDAEPWTLSNWTILHKPAVLAGERQTAAALRQRLSAQGHPA
ncbi:MAG: gamma-glutamylcyclotransferase family protein [Cypionkella sp.]